MLPIRRPPPLTRQPPKIVGFAITRIISRTQSSIILASSEGHPADASGQRRIEAFKKLGWSEIPYVTCKNLDDVTTRLKAERDENICRKPFTISESVAIGKRLEELESREAKKRQKEAGEWKVIKIIQLNVLTGEPFDLSLGLHWH